MKRVFIVLCLAILWPSFSYAQTIEMLRELDFGAVAHPSFSTNTFTIEPSAGGITISGPGDGFISGGNTRSGRIRVTGIPSTIVDVEAGNVGGGHAGLAMQNCKMEIRRASSPPDGTIQDCDIGDGATYIPVRANRRVNLRFGFDMVVSPTATPGVKIVTYDVIINF